MNPLSPMFAVAPRAALGLLLAASTSILQAAAGEPAGLDQLGAGETRPAGQTLVLSTAPRLAYNLGDELEFLLLQLRSMADRVEAVSVSDVRPEQLSWADHIVVFCPQPAPILPPLLLSNLVSGLRPVLWVGHIADALLRHPLFEGKFAPPPRPEPRLSSVRYQGREWALGDAYWIPMSLVPDSGAAVALSLTEQGQPGLLSPSWRQGAITFISAIPAPGRFAFLLADVELDFLGKTDARPSRVWLRIDDYQAGSDHEEFERKVDFLGTRGRPFLVSVTPSWRDSPTGAVMTLDNAPEFVNGLRYAQARGGRLLLCGTLRDGTQRPEFWDALLDRPLTNAPSEIRRRIEEAGGLMLKHGLLPLGWQTPGNAASRAVYHEVARIFSTSVERPQLSDLTDRETALLSRPTTDHEGRRILPENLGFLPASATNGIDSIRERAVFITRLRGTVAGARFHAYLTSTELMGLVGVLEEFPFLDFGQLANWMHLPGRLLLTGGAECAVHLAGGVLTWKAYDHAGRLLFTEQEFVLPGERTLKRKGRGECELYEFAEVTP